MVVTTPTAGCAARRLARPATEDGVRLMWSRRAMAGSPTFVRPGASWAPGRQPSARRAGTGGSMPPFKGRPARIQQGQPPPLSWHVSRHDRRHGRALPVSPVLICLRRTRPAAGEGDCFPVGSDHKHERSAAALARQRDATVRVDTTGDSVMAHGPAKPATDKPAALWDQGVATQSASTEDRSAKNISRREPQPATQPKIPAKGAQWADHARVAARRPVGPGAVRCGQKPGPKATSQGAEPAGALRHSRLSFDETQKTASARHKGPRSPATVEGKQAPRLRPRSRPHCRRTINGLPSRSSSRSC